MQKIRLNIEIWRISGARSAHFFHNSYIFKGKKLHKNSATEDFLRVLLKEIAARLTNWFYFCLPMTGCHRCRQFVFPFTKHETSCQKRAKSRKRKIKQKIIKDNSKKENV